MPCNQLQASASFPPLQRTIIFSFYVAGHISKAFQNLKVAGYEILRMICPLWACQTSWRRGAPVCAVLSVYLYKNLSYSNSSNIVTNDPEAEESNTPHLHLSTHESLWCSACSVLAYHHSTILPWALCPSKTSELEAGLTQSWYKHDFLLQPSSGVSLWTSAVQSQTRFHPRWCLGPSLAYEFSDLHYFISFLPSSGISRSLSNSCLQMIQEDLRDKEEISSGAEEESEAEASVLCPQSHSSEPEAEALQPPGSPPDHQSPWLTGEAGPRERCRTSTVAHTWQLSTNNPLLWAWVTTW